MIFSSALLRSVSGRSSLKVLNAPPLAAARVQPCSGLSPFRRRRTVAPRRSAVTPQDFSGFWSPERRCSPRAPGPVNRPGTRWEPLLAFADLRRFHRRRRQLPALDEELEVVAADGIRRVQLQAGAEGVLGFAVAIRPP